MANIKVLWIDDEPNKEFIAMGHRSGLDIVQVLSVNVGKKRLQTKKWDAIILDVNCKLGTSDKEIESPETLSESLKLMRDEIPYFIYTGGNYNGAETVNRFLHKEDYQYKKCFEKGYDRDKLFDNIKEAVKNNPRYLARMTFSDVCDFYTDDDLVDLLVEMRTNKINTDEMVPTKVRNILSWIMKKLNDQCVLPIKPNENFTNLADCSRFLGNDKMKEIVPLHIQRRLFSSVSIANEGAHRNDGILTKVQTMLKNGEAPYLNIALVYDLLNILKWGSSLDKNRKDNRRRKTIDILKKYNDKDGYKYLRIEGSSAIFINNKGEEKKVELAYI